MDKMLVSGSGVGLPMLAGVRGLPYDGGFARWRAKASVRWMICTLVYEGFRMMDDLLAGV